MFDWSGYAKEVYFSPIFLWVLNNERQKIGVECMSGKIKEADGAHQSHQCAHKNINKRCILYSLTRRGFFKGCFGYLMCDSITLHVLFIVDSRFGWPAAVHGTLAMLRMHLEQPPGPFVSITKVRALHPNGYYHLLFSQQTFVFMAVLCLLP